MRYPQRLYHLEGDITVEPSASIQSMWSWVERFQNECARLNRSPQTIIEYGYDLASLIEYLDHIPLSSFAEADSRILRDYLDWLRLNAEVSTVTLNRRLACLR
ncbi:MAG: site-specific integrase, partial [Symbiobacteriaceae bacterium]|nr:site-specific integrase [Symbiobacteriaceae bacterium]